MLYYSKGLGTLGKEDPEGGLHNGVGWAPSHTASVIRTETIPRTNINGSYIS